MSWNIISPFHFCVEEFKMNLIFNFKRFVELLNDDLIMTIEPCVVEKE